MLTKHGLTIGIERINQDCFISLKAIGKLTHDDYLAIIDLKTNKELDMGSPYDFFGISSHILYPKLTKTQKENRQLLQTIMRKYNFRPYSKEWWHFTLRNEPFPTTYFKFPIN